MRIQLGLTSYSLHMLSGLLEIPKAERLGCSLLNLQNYPVSFLGEFVKIAHTRLLLVTNIKTKLFDEAIGYDTLRKWLRWLLLSLVAFSHVTAIRRHCFSSSGSSPSKTSSQQPQTTISLLSIDPFYCLLIRYVPCRHELNGSNIGPEFEPDEYSCRYWQHTRRYLNETASCNRFRSCR
jgi:hypothetical protein